MASVGSFSLSTQPNLQRAFTISDHINVADHIAATILMAFDHFATQSFEKFRNYHNRLCVFPADNAEEYEDANGRTIGFSRYVFEDYGFSEKEMNIRIDTHGSIRVRYRRRWMKLEKYFLGLPPITNIWTEPRSQLSPEDKQKLWDDQWDWWRRNDKTFRFLNLPFDIREVIYSFAVVGDIRPCPGRKGSFRRPRSSTASFQAELPNVRLLKTNRQIYHEASHVLYRDSTILIERSTIPKLLADGTAYARIRKLCLYLPHKEYLQVFDSITTAAISRSGSKKGGPTIDASLLRKMKLRDLTIGIAMPRKDSDPVLRVSEIDQVCQKTTVDWIFEAVWSWIRGHPVRLQGGIKDQQRHDFLEKCKAERKAFLEWCELKPLGYVDGTLVEYDDWMSEVDGGIRLDGCQKPFVKEIEDAPVRNYPPLCQCAFRCSDCWTPAN